MAVRGSSKLPKPSYGPHVIILFLFTFAAFILTILVTFSSPFISSISFLYVNPEPGSTGSQTTFGAFGWCAGGYCLPSSVGYEFGTNVNRSLTGGMILWAITIVFIFFTLLAILPLLFVHESKALRYVGNKMWFSFASDMAAILIAVAWILSIAGWSTANRSFELQGLDSHLGSAMWMGLSAALLMVIIVVFLGWPNDAWDSAGANPPHGVPATSGGVGIMAPRVGPDDYYSYRRTTREVVPSR